MRGTPSAGSVTTAAVVTAAGVTAVVAGAGLAAEAAAGAEAATDETRSAPIAQVAAVRRWVMAVFLHGWVREGQGDGCRDPAGSAPAGSQHPSSLHALSRTRTPRTPS